MPGLPNCEGGVSVVRHFIPSDEGSWQTIEQTRDDGDATPYWRKWTSREAYDACMADQERLDRIDAAASNGDDDLAWLISIARKACR
jgi:hypothetical protein